MKNRKLLMIPGPIEFEPEVNAAMAVPVHSHFSAPFAEIFGSALERTRKVFLSTDGQPMIVAGTGTLAMDMSVCNLVEPGDQAVVISTGFFGDRFVDIFERYGAKVTVIRPAIGGFPGLDEVESVLSKGHYKVLAVTHVDTSSGVCAPVQALGKLAQKYGVLSVVDGVCSVAGEELRTTEWGLDVVLTASQKAVGVPPGLALMMISPKALAAFRARKTPVANYYGDWGSWLPVMEAYEARKLAYFGTPAINLINALNVSLGIILSEGMEARFTRHALMSNAFKAGIFGMGLKQIPLKRELEAHTMTTIYYPAGIDNAKVLPTTIKEGVILSGGLHKEIKDLYFRVGHMGSVSIADVMATLGTLETALAVAGYQFQHGAGAAAAMAEYLKK